MSSVKTRLAASIGKEDAEAFYRLSIAAIEETLISLDQRFSPHWVIAEEAGIDAGDWQTFPAFWTGDGDLGQRLANVFEKLFDTHDAVMLIGTDSPQLTVDTFTEAVDYLTDHPGDCVVGPADDGGFYLFVCAKPVPRKIWESVTYSVSSTLEELEAGLKDIGRNVHRTSAEQDVDTLEDLKKLYATLENSKSHLSPAKRKLLTWLDETIT